MTFKDRIPLTVNYSCKDLFFAVQTLNAQYSILNAQYSMLNTQCSILNTQSSKLTAQSKSLKPINTSSPAQQNF